MEDTNPVPNGTKAYCPMCDARLARHVDGRCPNCGDELEMSPDHAARIADAFESRVREIARDHAPSGDDSGGLAGEPLCAMCFGKTPLALDSALDVSKANEFDDLVELAEDAIEAIGEDSWWLRSELGDAYENAFYNACAPPERCVQCWEASAEDTSVECGHDFHGEPCPAREDDVDRGDGIETDGGVDVILFSNDGGKDHLALASGDGTLCGYVPDGWVGRNAANHPDELAANNPNVCQLCLASLRTFTSDIDRGDGIETGGDDR